MFDIIYILNKNEMERDFKWVRIPKEIWLSEDLNMMCKVLLTEIDSLSKNEEWCYAWNEYFAKFLWISTIQVSRYISFLKENLYIEEVSFNWRTRVIKSTIERGVKAALSKMIKQPNQKWQSSIIKNDKHINIYSNTSINSSSKEEDSEAVLNDTTDDIDDFVKNLPAVPEKKEKSSAKKERKDITELIITLKATCTVEWVVYDNEDERMYAKHILDAEKFWEVAEWLGMSRQQFAVAVLKESIINNFWKGYCTWPKKIYNSYVEIVNRFIANRNKQSNAVLDDL